MFGDVDQGLYFVGCALKQTLMQPRFTPNSLRPGLSSAGAGRQGFEHTRQAFCQLSYSPRPGVGLLTQLVFSLMNLIYSGAVRMGRQKQSMVPEVSFSGETQLSKLSQIETRHSESEE